MSTVKLHTGDLFLANRWTLGSLIGHLIDRPSRWSDVGLIVIRDPSEQNQNDTEQTGEPIVNVFLLTDEGSKEISLDSALRDPLLQTAAFRAFAKKGNISTMTKLKAAVDDFKGVNKEDIVTLIEETKGYDIIRNGFTPSELISEVLNSAGVISRNNIFNRSMTSFQQGEYFDQFYGQEMPLYPRTADGDVTATLMSTSQKDAQILISDYANSKILMTYHIQNDRVDPPMRFKASNSQPESMFSQKPVSQKQISGYQTNQSSLKINTDRPPRVRVGKAKKLSQEEMDFRQTPVNIGMPEYNLNSTTNSNPRTTMPGQMSNYDRQQRQKKTVAIAEADASASLDKKLRHTKSAAAQFVRPTPKYTGNIE